MSGLLAPLLKIISWLERDRRSVRGELEALDAKLKGVVNENEVLREKFDELTRYVAEVDVQFARTRAALGEVREDEGFVQLILHTLRARWYIFYPDRAEPEEPVTTPTARVELTAKLDEEADLLDHCRRVLDEVHTIQVEVRKALAELAKGVFKTDTATAEHDTAADFPRSTSDLVFQRRLARTEQQLREVRIQHKQRAAEAERKLREVETEHKKLQDAEAKRISRQLQQERTKATQRGTSSGSTDRRVVETNGLFAGTGLFLAGLLVREVLRMRELSDTQQLFLTALTFVLVGLPCWSLVKWARSAEGPAPGTAALAAVLCVVVGYFSWPVALVPVLLALSAVVVTKRVGGGFVLVAVVAVVFAVSLPRLVFWSWTGVDWFASLF
ncbi:hypothetical protein ACFFQW_06000 [Umezawaea endophytica]|uniref:Uncharacterized protein n=1 Tax=Umezawaea endophytica TaxID=1654476 RepID=A0A9X2VQS3_9PSEU|nr:hypothetical protein [Umezawaea endophytica]MCS7481120.1 hypothetical protein [Umezawaea endophytica]